MAAQHDHWRNLGKGPDTNPTDKSTAAILDRLKAPRDPSVVEAHAGKKSVNADGVMSPMQHQVPDKNAAANAEFNGSTIGARETTDVARLIGAGVIKGN